LESQLLKTQTDNAPDYPGQPGPTCSKTATGRLPLANENNIENNVCSTACFKGKTGVQLLSSVKTDATQMTLLRFELQKFLGSDHCDASKEKAGRRRKDFFG
jgi:hypothetical protein